MDHDMTTTTPTRTPAHWRRLVAEFLGTGLLVAIVVGSGIMASRLSPDDVGLQLLENSLATALGLADASALTAKDPPPPAAVAREAPRE
jgi:glycerol uptake facilitator-like aquaporin